MKRLVISVILALVLVICSVSTALAAKPEKFPDGGKPQDVIARSNGFPSGKHFNLNLHGREYDWDGNPEPGGKSLFICLSGDSTIEYVSNKKSKVTDLYVIDPLAECFDEDPARVFLPYKINIGDESTPDIVDAGGYYVFGRILGSPNKGSEGVSRIIIWPSFVVQACNMTAGADETEFGDLRDCLNAGADLALGLITSSGNLYGATEQYFTRFPDPEPVRGKGKSQGVPITDLLMWSGYVTDNTSLDVWGPGEGNLPDGKLSIEDLGDPDNGYLIRPEWAPLRSNWSAAGQLDPVTEEEFKAWLAYLAANSEIYSVYYLENEWIFDIADLVIAGQTFTNDGTKLFQIRFYPKDYTNFDPEP